MAASGSASGGVVMGLQPVYDGTWSSRWYNVLVGSVTGALFTPLAGPVLSATGAVVAPLVRATGLKVGETSRSVGNAIVKLYDAKKANRGRVVESRGGKGLDNSVNSKDRVQFEKMRTKYRQDANWVNPTEIKNDKLRNLINDLYRPNAKVGSGSTSDAVRVELKVENLKVGGRSHKIKAENAERSLTDMLQSNSLSSHERMIAENVRLDLLDSLGKKLWYSQTNTPKY